MRAFTLIELLVVLIIVGILAAITIPNYTKTRERALNKEAQTVLSLIQAGERMYRLRASTYFNSTNLTSINDNLTLSLVSQSWNYTIPSSDNLTFTARADRVGGGSWARYLWINATAANATCVPTSGACP